MLLTAFMTFDLAHIKVVCWYGRGQHPISARPDTPIPTLQTETDCLPMSDRMTILTLSYWLKLNLNFPSSDPVETLHPLHPMTDEMELFSAQPELFGRTTWAKQLGLLIRKYWIQPSESVKQDKPPAPWGKPANSNSIAFELTELPRAKSECTFEELETARKLVEEKVEEV